MVECLMTLIEFGTQGSDSTIELGLSVLRRLGSLDHELTERLLSYGVLRQIPVMLRGLLWGHV